MVGAILVWLIAFFFIIALLVLIIYQLICFADLEFDYINPYDLASRINAVLLPEFALQGFLCLLFLFSGHWLMFLLCTPVIYYNWKIADKSVLASSGFQGDIKALQKNLAAKHLIYQHQHNKQMSCPAMAQLLSNTLYYKRFFPYYAFNVLGGLDNEGKGCVFTYDAVGSYEKVGYSAQGSGSTLVMPVLDNQLRSPSPLLLPAKDAVTPLSESEAVDMVKDVFASATERDIYTGDKVEIVVINAAGIRREFIELRKD